MKPLFEGLFYAFFWQEISGAVPLYNWKLPTFVFARIKFADK